MKHRKLLTSLLLLGLALPSLSAPKPAKPDVSQYLRFKAGRKADALEVAVTSFKHPKTEVQVDLVGVIHIGDRAYYEKLNKMFKNYDAVLFEMVGDPRKIKKADPKKNTSAVTVMQRWMKTVLELDFQLDIVDYKHDHFIHADMDQKTFAKRMEDRGESLLSLMWKMMQQDLAREQRGEPVPQIDAFDLLRVLFSPNRGTEMKRLIARNMSELETAMNALEAGDGTVIITERNKVALKVLRKTLEDDDKKRIAIFYGAGHMPDMEERMMNKFGVRRTGTTWLTAWHLPK